jgi:hypothetical protein
MPNEDGGGRASGSQGACPVACQNAMDACESSVIQKAEAIICLMKLLKKQIGADIQFVKT